MKDPKRILITRTDRLGDVVLSTPVIRHMRKLYPEAYIAFLVRPQNKAVVESNPDLNEVIVYDKYGTEKSFFKTIKFALGLRKKNFDTAIALHPTNRAHMIFFIAGVPVRIGYDRKMACLLTEKIPHIKQEGKKHEVGYNFDLLEKAGFYTEGFDRTPYMSTSKEDKLVVDAVLKDNDVKRNIIVMHPGASCISKRWPPERFAEVADVLSSKYNRDIVIVGGEETEELSSQVIEHIKTKAVDLTGVLLLSELAELLSRSSLFISNDSGPVHVSVAVGTPVVAIFGRKDPGLSPERWGPLGEKDIYLHKDVGCDKCLAHKCLKGFACLTAITSEDVIKASDKILGQADFGV